MELARWLVAFVAFITGIGGLLADYFLSSGAQHIRNPRWPPHAKFHNAQGILMGVLLATLTIALLFHKRVLDRETLLLTALVASVYWLAIFTAPLFPGVAFVDPEFAASAPNVGKVPLQLAIGLVLVGLLVAAVFVGFILS